jgi:type I restriction enzyme R subunit
MNDKSIQKVVTGWLSSEAYRKLRNTPDDGLPTNASADSAEGSLSVDLGSSDGPV